MEIAKKVDNRAQNNCGTTGCEHSAIKRDGKIPILDKPEDVHQGCFAIRGATCVGGCNATCKGISV